MSGQIFTYPVDSELSKEVIDELIHYSAYRRFKKLLGDEITVNVVTSGLTEELSSKIKEIDSEFKILKIEDYGEELNDFTKSLYEEGKIELVKKRRYYCKHCNAYYTKDEIKFKESEVVYNIARVRIGRRLYFIDKIIDGADPFGVAISKDDDLLYVNMDNETWIAPQYLKDVLIDNIEIPEDNIKTGKIEDIKIKGRLVGYVTLDSTKTEFILKENVDSYNLKKRISSYTVIYSIKTTTKKEVCPRCGEPVEEIDIPKLYLNIDEKKVEFSSDSGTKRIPLLYCNACGHLEYGLATVKNCPVCGNVMELKFFYAPSFIPLGLYYKEVEGAGIAYLHEKRQKYTIINKLLGASDKKISEREWIIHSKYPDTKVDNIAYLLKNRGTIGDNTHKLKKLENILANLKKYVSIYGEAEPRDVIDNWILYLNEKTKKEFVNRIENGNFMEAFELLYNFVIKNISRYYVAMKRKESIVTSPIIDSLKMLYVFDPEFSKEYLQNMGVEELTLQLGEMKEVKGMEVVRDIVRYIMKFRKEKGIPRREPLKKVVFVTEHVDILKDFSDIIMKFTNILVFNPTEKWEEMDMTIEPDIEAINRMYRAWAPKIAFLLKRKNIKDVMNALDKGGYTMGIEGFVIRITPDMVKFIEKVPKGYVKMKARYGDLYINTERDITTMRIRMVNEVIRRINYMRRDIDMDYDDVIDVSISSDDYILRILRGYVDEIKERTRARNVEFEYVEYAYVIEWPIMDFNVIIGINPLFKKWVIKAFQSIPGIAENKAETLFQMGYGSIYELMRASPTDLAEIPGFSVSFANKIKDYLYATAFKSKIEKGNEICPFCGTELGEEDDFCPRCGAPIRVEFEKKEGIKEGKVYLAWGDFSKIGTLISTTYGDVKKVMITKEDPDNIKKEYNLKNTTVIWISYVPMGKNIKPKELDMLKEAIEKNLGKGAKIVMWDAFDFMVAINGFDRMLEFIKEIKEDIKNTNSILLFNVEELEDDEEIEKLREIVDGKI